MTSRERLLAAIAGQPVDRIPVAPRAWRYASSKGMDLPQLAKEFGYDLVLHSSGLGNGVLRGDEEWMAEFLPDVRLEIQRHREGDKTYTDRNFHTPGGVLRDRTVQADRGGEYGISPNPEWLEPIIKTVEDLECLPYLLPDPKLVEKGFADAREMEAQIGNTGIMTFRPSIGVDELVLDSLGVERALTASLVEPNLFQRAVEMADDWHTGIIRCILEGGFKIVFDTWFHFSLSVGWSPNFYRDTVMPLLKKHAELIHSYDALMFFYDDGKMADSIGYVIEAGVDIIQTLTPPPCGDLDYAWLAENHGGKVCFNGGVDTVKIRFGQPDEIAADVRNQLDALAPTGRYILGTSDSITEGTPDENINAFFATGFDYGREVAHRLYGG